MKITGIIKNVDYDERWFSILINRQEKFFYLKNSLVKTFRRFLYSGNYVSFICSDTSHFRISRYVYNVEYLLKIYEPSKYSVDSFYDKDFLDKNLAVFLNSFNNTLFIDFEMTMPGFHKTKVAPTELIWVGFILYNNNWKEIDSYESKIKPTLHKKISARTLKFLDLEEKDFDDALPYEDFYNKMKSVIFDYSPVIFIWGKNDKLILEQSYKLNKFESLEKKSRFVNLLQIVKTYYNFQQDPGLFKMLKYYYGKNVPQTHNPYDDAMALKLIYIKFKEDVEKNKKLDFEYFSAL